MSYLKVPRVYISEGVHSSTPSFEVAVIAELPRSDPDPVTGLEYQVFRQSCRVMFTSTDPVVAPELLRTIRREINDILLDMGEPLE